MAGDPTRSSNAVPDHLAGLTELVRLLARQTAREAFAAVSTETPSAQPAAFRNPKET